MTLNLTSDLVSRNCIESGAYLLYSFEIEIPNFVCKCILEWQSVTNYFGGAQWLSGRVLDSRPKGRGFEPHRRHCVVVLEQDTFILA